MTLSLSFTADDLRSLEPRFGAIQEAELVAGLTGASESVGWLSTVVDTKNIPLGGGCARSRAEARCIALVETAERAIVRRLKLSPASEEDFLLRTFPTSCGFAAGFDPRWVLLRSLCEAVERWARSKWIDEHYTLEEIPLSEIQSQARMGPLSQAAEYFRTHFQEVRFFSRSFQVVIPNLRICCAVRIGVVVGLAGRGVFPGSQVCFEGQSPWEHALLEAWRHLQIYRNHRSVDGEWNISLPRILYFGDHADEGLRQISKATYTNWSQPDIRFSKSISLLSGRLKLSRSLCSGYTSWSDGGEDRFVY